MKTFLLALLTLTFFPFNNPSQAVERTLRIDNPSERAVYIARSIETQDEIITEGFWNVLPVEKIDFPVPNDGTLAVRVNFENDLEATNLPGSERCGSLTEKFKSIVKKSAEPHVIFFSGEGNLEGGYANKKEGKDCKEAGGEILKGFHEAVACDPSTAGVLCLPFTITNSHPTPSMYVGACNETGLEDVYLAVRFFENNEWKSAGWWEVQKDKCRKVGPFPTDKSVYVLAMNSSSAASPREWTPENEIIRGCINPETGFIYAEKADGSCEARETLPADAPPFEKAQFGKLVDPGFHGIAEFNILP